MTEPQVEAPIDLAAQERMRSPGEKFCGVGVKVLGMPDQQRLSEA